MPENGIKNARIVSTSLGNDDHGPSSWVHVEHDSGQQGFGGFQVNHGSQMSSWVLGVLDVLEVQSWEKLPNTYCRIKIEGGLIRAIGHIFKDQWYDPKKSMEVLERRS